MEENSPSAKKSGALRVAATVMRHCGAPRNGGMVMRPRMFLLITTLGIFSVMSSCTDLRAPEISGVYTYTAFDINGTQVSSGTLVLQVSDSLLSGELQLGEETTIFEGRVIEPASIELWEITQRLGVRGLTGVKDDGTIRGDVLLNTGAGPFLKKTGTFRADRAVG